MTQKFSKLNIGDIVTSSGNRVFKKLSTDYILKGIWIFNKSVTEHNFISQNITFICNSKEYSLFQCTKSGTTYQIFYGSNQVYNQQWNNPVYRIITIETPQIVSEEFYDWFTQNATQHDVATEGLRYERFENGSPYFPNYYCSGVEQSTATKVVIAPYYNGQPVVAISAEAFRGKGITSIKIPNTIVDIGSYAFEDCKFIKHIEIPSSVTTIADHAFYNCTSLESVSFGNNSQLTSIGNRAFQYCAITSVTIPNGVTSIGEGAFNNCTSLTSVTVGNGVTSIGDYAFVYCTSLESVYISDLEAWCNISFSDAGANPLCYGANLYLNGELVTTLEIPDSITKIKPYAFNNCTSLTSATIPDSVTSIGSSVFYGCSSLESITLPFVGSSKSATSASSSTLFGYIFGTSSYTGGVQTKQYYSSGYNDYATYYIPASLKSVTITGGNILYGAFYNCTSLTSITIPDSVTSIGHGAFEHCSSLTSITIPDSVTFIGGYAFYNCTSLKSITIPDSVTSIGYYAFRDCSSLKTVINESNLDIIKGETTHGYVAYYADKVIGVSTGLAFALSSDESYYIVYGIGDCIYTDIVISSTYKGLPVCAIAPNAFYENDKITSITLPNSITSIGYLAFYGCTSLESINIPDSVTSIGSEAFSICGNLSSVSFGENCKLTTIEYYVFSGCSKLKNITIPDSVTSICNWAFSGCGLTNALIGSGVTFIDSEAFVDCDNLISIVCMFPSDSVTGQPWGAVNAEIIYT